MISCPGCYRETEAGGKFCGFCGHPLPSPSPKTEADLSEQLAGDVLMRRIEPGKMQGLLNKTVEIEEGQAALLLIAGRHDRSLGPGKHSIGNVLSSTTRDASIVLFQTSDVSLLSGRPVVQMTRWLEPPCRIHRCCRHPGAGTRKAGHRHSDLETPISSSGVRRPPERYLVLSQPNCWQDRDGEA